MSTEGPRRRTFVLRQFALAFAEVDSPVRPREPRTLSVCDIDVSKALSDRPSYGEAPFRHVLEAIVKDFSEGFGDMEVGISNAWRTTLSLSCDGSTLYCSWVAVAQLVPDSEES